MAVVFWNCGILFVRYVPFKYGLLHKFIVGFETCYLSEETARIIRQSSKLIFLCDNMRPYTTHVTAALLRKYRLQVFPHPPYFLDLAPSDFHLFPALKCHSRRRLTQDVEVHAAVNDFFTKVYELYYDGLEKLVRVIQNVLIAWPTIREIAKLKFYVNTKFHSFLFVSYRIRRKGLLVFE